MEEKRIFDEDGYDQDGYDKYGNDRDGYDKKGFKIADKRYIRIHRNGTEFDNEGFTYNGFDNEGYNRRGFKLVREKGDLIYIHKNGTEFDDKGYNNWGYDKNGYDENGFKTIYGVDKNLHRTVRYEHKITRGAYDENGFNHNGEDKWGYDKRGFKKALYKNVFVHSNGTEFDDEGYDYYGYDKEGYDQNGYNNHGFNKQHIHKNGTEFDNEGFNYNGYDKEGYDRRGFKLDSEKGIYIHKNGTEYSDSGFDYRGYDKEGFNYRGYDKEGYYKDGYKDGFDREGFNSQGLNKQGLTMEQVQEGKNQRRKNFLGLKGKAEKLGKGEMTLEDYVKCSKTSIDDLIIFAKKENMNADVIRGLYKHKKLYATYKKPFAKADYLKSITLIINGQEVKPTEEDVDKCVEYLQVKGSLICDKTVRDTVRGYLKGEINITIKEAELEEQIEENKKIISENEQKISDELVGVLIEQQDKIKSQQTEIANLKKKEIGTYGE